MGGFGLVDAMRAREASGATRLEPDTSIIFIWLPGGPPHMETYDMKPDAPAETLRAWRMPNGPGDDFLYVLQSDGRVPSLSSEKLAGRLRESRPFFDGPVQGPSPSSTVAPPPTPATVVAARPAD